MRILFVNNQVDNRGTGNALFDYAHYNETLLGNQSLVMSLDMSAPNDGMHKRLTERFGRVYNPYDIISDQRLLNSIDYIYHIKSGENDGGMHVEGIPLGIHAVFNPTQPHGDRYATISKWMGSRFNVPYVPHMIERGVWEDILKKEYTEDFRAKLGIPKWATVFGRHGGPDTFDIPWVWDALLEVTEARSTVYFVFLGTKCPDRPLNSQFIFIPETNDDHYKYTFINSCDAMIHARQRGETYGIAVGEFAVRNKVVFTYRDSPEKAHIEMLGPSGLTYERPEELVDLLEHFDREMKGLSTEYHLHTPEHVMAKFAKVFLL